MTATPSSSPLGRGRRFSVPLLFKEGLGVVIVLLFFIPVGAWAISPELLEVYYERPDLQQAFQGRPYQGIIGTPAGFLVDLEDWAMQYGWQEDERLVDFAPGVTPIRAQYGMLPVPDVTADHFIILDDASGAILAEQGSDRLWPIASLTKLVTVHTALNHGLDVGGAGSVLEKDDVGGAKLYVEDGTTFTMRDLLYATLVGSANNAANAVARETGYETDEFIDSMNELADTLNLRQTVFADPTGIEVSNISTAREVAYFTRMILEDETIRKMTGTSSIHIEALNDEEYVRDIDNTNWLLYDPAYDDVYVTAGKTGFLYESGWNLMVQMHPMGEEEERGVFIVLFGADSRQESFDDAHELAWWAWNEFDWDRE